MPSTVAPASAVTGSLDPSSGRHSAPVLEFLCLFTHDLRRKQKRWQDGRLKYHTFNKRVMVYDDRGNFVGDMHWRGSDFDEGEEVELERGGIIVQVAECVGRQNQDLSELLDKRAKEKELRQARVAMRSSLSVPSPQTPSPAPQVRDHFQTRHLPLHQLLGTPTGHHGRAVVPTESPFELRQKARDASGNQADARPSKRRKHDTTPPSKMGYAQSLFGASLTLSAVPMSSAPPRRLVAPSNSSTERPSIQVAPATHAPLGRLPSLAAGESDRHVLSGEQGVRERAKEPSICLDMGKDSPGQPADLPPTRGRNQEQRRDRASEDIVRPTKPSEPVSSKTCVPALPTTIQPSPGIHGNGSGVSGAAQTGTSSSRAIVIDEDEGMAMEEAGEATKAPEIADGTEEPPLPISITKKKKLAKRSRVADLPARVPVTVSGGTRKMTEDVAPPKEDRTELRLRPRQKRGLLMLSEEKDSDQQLARSGTIATEPSRSIHDPAPSVDDTALAPAPQVRTENPYSKDERENRPPSPQVERSVQRGRITTTAFKEKEQQMQTNQDSENTLARVASEGSRRRSSSQTRRLKNVDEQRSATSKRKTQAESDRSDSEELPQVPVGPRLARLSKRSVRSREVIGFVPSNPPVANLPKTDEPASKRLQKPSAPRQNPPSDDVSKGSSTNQAVEEEEKPRAQQVGDPSSHRELAYHKSAALPRGGIGDEEAFSLSSVAAPEDATRTDNDEIPKIVRLCVTNDEEVAAQPSRLHEPRNTSKQVEHPMNATGHSGVDSHLTESENQPSPVISRPDTIIRPKIMNPATRGRKAALTSDAAGQVPQSILPTEPISARSDMVPPGAKRPDPAVGEGPKRRMRFPGFASARGGGPWSREAHDLLETGRPC